MKILNLYAGIGGNRKLWPISDKDEVVAVELNPEIATIYKEFFPKDTVIVGDAREYLLYHYQEFDFIWSSKPCPSHSGTNHFLHYQGVRRYPDFGLYEEIVFLKHFCKVPWVVENVKPYYEPLIKPQYSGRHAFWSNFTITDKEIEYKLSMMNREASKMSQRQGIIREAQVPELLDLHGLKDFKLKNKRQVLRNCVLPKLGLHIWNCAFKTKQEVLTYE